ncbi:MAG: sigma-70 family RNA polymerase sigma factor [Planctomycetaceae bacterium]
MLRRFPEPLVDESTQETVRRTVRKAIRKGVFLESDEDDLVQEILVKILLKRDLYDSTRASWPGFCTVLAKDYLYRRRRRERSRPDVQSLDTRQSDNGGNGYREVDRLTEGHSIPAKFSRCRPAEELSDLAQDALAAIEKLPPELRQICELSLEFESVTELAQQTGLSRGTIYRRRQQVRIAIKSTCLEDYR